MKSTGIAICLLFFLFTGMAQQIQVRENLEEIDDGINNALVVDIPDADKNDVSRSWRKLMNGAGAKVSGKTDIVAERVKIPLITTDTLVVFTTLVQRDSYVHMICGFRINGTYLSSLNDITAYNEAVRIVTNFALEQARLAVQKQIDDQKDKLLKLERKFKNLDEENKKLSRNIEDYTNKIKEAQSNISKNEKEKEQTSKDIDEQRKVVEVVQRKLMEIK